MLRRVDKLSGFTVRATDGDIGHVRDLFFDDDSWQVRYFVVNTGPWLFGRRVLISPHAVEPSQWNAGVLPVDLTKEQVKNSPDIDLEKPVSRQHEIELHQYYGWPTYWAGGAVLGAPTTTAGPAAVPPTTGSLASAEQSRTAEETLARDEESAPPVRNESKVHLRSASEVIGYHIQAQDGEIGHVADFFVSEKDWTIRYMMVDTRNWLPGRRVLILPDWVDNIDWAEGKVHVLLSREQVKDSPEFDPQGPLDRSYETTFYDYYGQPYYWV